MKYLSVCSGIEAATAAWHGLGWTPVAFSEIDKFPAAVLAHHYPNVPNWGDMTKFQEWPDATVDVLVGGTPCQSFSVAGLRAGLADPRGNLALTYLAIAERYRPEWLVWENVPGVLSADGGRAFGAIIGGMVELGYCPAWRVLDAQYIRTRRYPHAVPQRRRRVFVVAHLGDWRRAAAVLFDAESLRGNPAPSREAGEATAHSVAPCIGASGRGFEQAGETRGQDPVVAHFQDSEFGCKQYDTAAIRAGRIPEHSMILSTTAAAQPIVPECANPLTHRMHKGINTTCDEGQTPIPVAYSIMPMNSGKDYKARPTDVAQPLMAGGPVGGNQGGDFVAQPVAFDTTQVTSKHNYSNPKPGDPCHPLAAGAHAPAVAFGADLSQKSEGIGYRCEVSTCVAAGTHPGHGNHVHMVAGDHAPAVASPMAVRRLTPVECERLQGFPDNFTRIPWRNKPAENCPDGPRYKALGNSMAVNCMEWLGERIQIVEETV